VAVKPAAVLGIIGGGQLGRMLAQAALPLGVQVQVLDPDADCPARPLAARHLKAGYGDLEALSELAQGCDAVTLEIEAPPAELLGRLEAAGVPVRPGASVLARIQDKLNRDEAELKTWHEKVEETRAKASGTAGKPQTFTCPCCGVVLEHRLADGALIEYVAPEQKADPEAVEKLPEYEKALSLMESAVANGMRDLAAADSAANALRELEDSGLADPPDADAITAAKRLLEDLKQKRTNLLGQIKAMDEAARAAEIADKKTSEAAQHHADVAAGDAIGRQRVADQIPGGDIGMMLGGFLVAQLFLQQQDQ
jgi:hypothetical protein